MKKPTMRSPEKARHTCWPRASTFCPERRSIAATSAGVKITWASTKRVASGNATFCACSTLRYRMARAGAAIETTIAGGAAHLTQPVVGRMLIEVEPEAAENGVGFRAAALAVEHLLVRQLEDELWRRKHRYAEGMELELAGARRRVHIRALVPRGLQILVCVPIEGHRLPR